jgi:hypothetical protein
MCDLQTGSRESVILMSKRKNQEEHLESCDLVHKDQNIKTEEEIKDDELTFILKDDATNDIDDDELIFKYIHKKFGTKNRECTPIVKKIDSIVLEVDPLEGTSWETELLNR